jgi:hypothetical protein
MMEYEQKDSDDRDGPPLTKHGAMGAVLHPTFGAHPQLRAGPCAGEP